MLRNFMREVSQVVSKLIWEIKTKLLPKLSILTELVYAQFSWALLPALDAFIFAFTSKCSWLNWV